MFKPHQDKVKPDRAFAPGADGAKAPEGSAEIADHGVHAPASREAEPLVEGEKHDQLAEKEKSAEDRQEALLDEGLEESFPSSDPVSVKRIT